MILQFRRLDFHEIGFHMFDNSVADTVGQKIDNRGMNFRRRSERPAFLAALVDHLRDLIGQLLVNSAIVFVINLRPLGDGGSSAVSARASSNWKTSGQVADFVDQLPMRGSDIEGLN